MKMLTKVLLAALLTSAALISTPAVSRASTNCDICADTGACFNCCRCGGGTIAVCAEACN